MYSVKMNTASIDSSHKYYIPSTFDNQVRGAEVCGTCSAHGAKTSALKIFVGEPGGKNILGRHGFRWDDIFTCISKYRRG
jgi:hypothetical protein